MTGKIKFYNASKGFGFIKDDDSDAEYFFHFSGLISLSIRDNDKVKFELEKDRRKYDSVRATKIERI